ncbi:MAG: ribonuclease PH [Gemmatimonadetes bacterium]|nr:ribonuclease PH [Gemmatimonadota bacterium]
MRKGRGDRTLRAVSLELGAAPYAEGSCLVSFGETRVLCAASIDETLPPWRAKGTAGWVTAEYAMLPRATHSRSPREREGARGRSQEIQRLIGRALRATVDLEALGPRTIIVDCDVLQADGGTRTAAVTGGCVALALACRSLERSRLEQSGIVHRSPLRGLVAAVSVGWVEGRPLLDLEYSEDRVAEVDMNVVALEDGRLVEVQGAAEAEAFPRSALDTLLDLAEAGLRDLHEHQRQALNGPGA